MARLAWCLGLFLVPQVAHAQTPQVQTIDTLVKETLKQWHVPGVAIAVVHGERIVYLKGHGVKELGRPDSVTPDTLFPLASCTKPFTSLAAAMLVSEGKMAWDDHVRKHVPFFHLSDPLADSAVTVRDLLAHRTGVGSHDLLWYKAPWDLEERIRKIGKVELEESFRAGFHYQTILFGTAGYAAGKAAGSNWQDLIQKRILDPLGMTASHPTFTGAADLAVPHRQDAHGNVAPLARYPLDRPDPAGSLHSTARDLSRFLRLQLGDGLWQGKRLLAAEALAETHRPQMIIRREEFARVMNPATVQISYGLGWIVQDYRSQLLLQHGGAIDGFRAHLTLVPEAKLGIALLNNLDRGFMNLALSNLLIDQFLGLSYRDWNAYYLDIQAKEEAKAREHVQAIHAVRKAGAKPSLPLKSYTGKFEDAAYGPCEIIVEDGQLFWLWGSWRCPLEHYEDDVFLATTPGLINGVAEFHKGPGGSVTSLKMVGRVFRRL